MTAGSALADGEGKQEQLDGTKSVSPLDEDFKPKERDQANQLTANKAPQMCVPVKRGR